MRQKFACKGGGRRIRTDLNLLRFGDHISPRDNPIPHAREHTRPWPILHTDKDPPKILLFGKKLLSCEPKTIKSYRMVIQKWCRPGGISPLGLLPWESKSRRRRHKKGSIKPWFQSEPVGKTSSEVSNQFVSFLESNVTTFAGGVGSYLK